MVVNDLCERTQFDLVVKGNMNKAIEQPFCCDLLSVAMSKAPASSAWVTVMGNINTIAVASLTDAACIVLAEGMKLDVPALEKAKSENITVFYSEQSIFKAAHAIYQLIDE